MKENDTSLIKSKDSIFKKIVDWFKNLFWNKNNSSSKELIENNIEIQESSDSKLMNEDLEFDNYKITEEAEEQTKDTKKKFFELYSDIKNEKVDIKDLSLEDLKKFNIMIQEEISLKQYKLENIMNQNEILTQKVLDLNGKFKFLELYDKSKNVEMFDIVNIMW